MSKNTLILLVLSLLNCFSLQAALPIAPSWSGEIKLNSDVKINIRFNFKEDTNGKFSVTLDSPEQGVSGMPGVINSISAKGFDVAVPQISLKYSATIVDTDQGKVANGIFNQITVSTPLIMKPGGEKSTRPQTPVPPFPYINKEVSFNNPTDGTVLKGTLTLPSSYYEGTPVVVLVSDRGLHNRDAEIHGHLPFAVIADYLARIGIGTLRYDDRGVGESEGEGENATMEEFVGDAIGGLKYLKEVEKFNKVGILGHGEGVEIAFTLIDSEAKPDMIVGLSSPSLKDEMISEANCPILMIYGGKDTQVNAKQSPDQISKLQPEASVLVYPDLNHLLQHAKTGSPSEYGQIEETIAPEVLSEISRFIQKNR